MTGFLASEFSSLASAVVTLGKGLSLSWAGHGQLCACLRRQRRLTLDNVSLILVLQNVSDFRDSLILHLINPVEARLLMGRLFLREPVDLLEACNGARSVIGLDNVRELHWHEWQWRDIH